MADITIPEAFMGLLSQSPLALAGVYVAHFFMKKHESAMAKLLTTFENEVKACDARYAQVFAELMKIKDSNK